MTTLTREALLEKGKPRCEVVKVDGVGEVMIRSLTEVKRCIRERSYYDATGKLKPESLDDMRADAIMDQVMIDESTPMFTKDDRDQIKELDAVFTARLYDAIKAFNGEGEAEKNDGSTGGQES